MSSKFLEIIPNSPPEPQDPFKATLPAQSSFTSFSDTTAVVPSSASQDSFYSRTQSQSQSQQQPLPPSIPQSQTQQSQTYLQQQQQPLQYTTVSSIEPNGNGLLGGITATGPLVGPTSSGGSALRSTSSLNDSQPNYDLSPALNDPYHDEPPATEKYARVSRTRESAFLMLIFIANFIVHFTTAQFLLPLRYVVLDMSLRRINTFPWFLTSFTLTVAVFSLISARLALIFPLRRLFALSCFLFAIFSALLAFTVYSHDHIAYNIFQAILGIPTSMVVASSLCLLYRTYSLNTLRIRVLLAIFSGLAPIGLAIGTLFSAAFTQFVWWPFSLWTFGLMFFVVGALSLLIIPRDYDHYRYNYPVKFDLLGGLLGIIGLCAFAIAFNNAALYTWSNPHVYFSLIIGVVITALSLWVESRSANPILPVNALNSKPIFILLLTGIGWASYGIWLHFVFRFFIFIRRDTSLSIALQFLPAFFAGILATLLTIYLLSHTPLSFTLFLSMVAFFLASILAFSMKLSQSYWSLAFLSILTMPFALTLSFPSATLILSNSMSTDHLLSAASLVLTASYYATSIFLGVASTVETRVLGKDPDFMRQIFAMRSFNYVALGLSACSVLFCLIYFSRDIRRNGWSICSNLR